jgi:L-ascorbate metabolism protein UlaG (beta-lactamase superfamily)
VSFTGVATYHDDVQGKERGENTVFAFEVDGLKICHLGDLGHVLTPDQVAQVGEVDILLLPVGGRATVDADAATQVMGQLNPKVTIPMHYKTDKIKFPFAPVDDFLRRKYEVRRLGMPRLELSKDNMPPRPEIMVISPAL